MPLTDPYHTIEPETHPVYHNKSNCPDGERIKPENRRDGTPDGERIKPENRRDGTDGRPLCQECPKAS